MIAPEKKIYRGPSGGRGPQRYGVVYPMSPLAQSRSIHE